MSSCRDALKTMTRCHDAYDCFFSYTRQSSESGWAAKSFVHQLARLLQRLGKSCFYDAESLVGEKVVKCVHLAGSAGVLVCILDDAFPSMWCLREIVQAITHSVPIVTIYDQEQFLFKEVGKDAWLRKQIPCDIVQAVFARGSIPFNSHPFYVEGAEQKFRECLMNLLVPQHKLSFPASIQVASRDDEYHDYTLDFPATIAVASDDEHNHYECMHGAGATRCIFRL